MGVSGLPRVMSVTQLWALISTYAREPSGVRIPLNGWRALGNFWESSGGRADTRK